MFNYYKKNKIQKKKPKLVRGFTLLVAVVVTSMLLIVSFAVVNVAVRQLVLANSNEESQYAFYAADSGVECAVYWDFKDGTTAFATSSTSVITCNGQNFTVGGGDSNATSTFTLNLATGCATISVGKHNDGTTIIDSKGYNTCSGLALRRLERGQKLVYEGSSSGGGGGSPPPPPTNRTMTVTFAGTGTGTVSGNAVACAPTCVFSDGSNVTFTATPGGGSSFTGWSGGGCSGSGTCIINPMDSDRATTATFASGGGGPGSSNGTVVQDVYENPIGTVDSSSATIWVGGDSNQYVGLRFTNVTVPQGATISSARVEVNPSATAWTSINFNIFADDVDNSASLTGTPPSSRTPTTAVVNHNSNVNWVAGTWYSVGTITSIIQEIVNRPGWVSGNSITIIFRGNGAQFGRKLVNSLEGSASNAPRIFIDYN